MGRGRKRRQRPGNRGIGGKRVTFDLRVTDVEIEKGHDGLLRGGPDPAICLALCSARAETLSCLGRALVRAKAKTMGGPERIVIDDAERVRVKFSVDQDVTMIVLMIALEEDNGRGVRAAFEMLGNPETMCVWRGERDVLPVPLTALAAHGVPYLEPVPVDIGAEGEDKNAFAGDKWVGAGLMQARFEEHRFERTLRFPVRADDGKNAWTVGLSLRWR